MKQIIKKLDKPHHYDMIVSSLNGISQIGLECLGNTSYWTTEETLFKSITKEQLVWIFADSEC